MVSYSATYALISLIEDGYIDSKGYCIKSFGRLLARCELNMGRMVYYPELLVERSIATCLVVLNFSAVARSRGPIRGIRAARQGALTTSYSADAVVPISEHSQVITGSHSPRIFPRCRKVVIAGALPARTGMSLSTRCNNITHTVSSTTTQCHREKNCSGETRGCAPASFVT